MSEGRRICTGILDGDEKKPCRAPIMILRSGPVSEIGSNKVKQVTLLGCLCPNCDKYNVVVDRIENELESFTE